MLPFVIEIGDSCNAAVLAKMLDTVLVTYWRNTAFASHMLIFLNK